MQWPTIGGPCGRIQQEGCGIWEREYKVKTVGKSDPVAAGTFSLSEMAGAIMGQEIPTPATENVASPKSNPETLSFFCK